MGAYTFALLNSPHLEHLHAVVVHLPLGAILAAFFGIMLGTPVLRLRVVTIWPSSPWALVKSSAFSRTTT